MINLFIITLYKQNKLKTLGIYCKNYLIITSTIITNGRG
jgi:hypothetical protein